MTLALATGNLEHFTTAQGKVVGQRLQLVVRLHAFHRQPAGIVVAEVACPTGEIRQRAECSRSDAVEGPFRAVLLDPAVDNLKVGQLQFELYLGEKARLLA